uniref:Nucleosome assembly protein 1-like 1 n=1 Tax=Stomoxys calcitrans TaxID=35570 RepID=A0A1I8PFI7_STOCA
MDVKPRVTSKASKALPLSEKMKQLESQNKPKYSDKEIQCIADLKTLYLDTIKLDVELQESIHKMEKAFESKHDEIFDKRLKLLEHFKKQNQGGDATKEDGMANFWLKVLKASYTEFISKKDEKILVYLKDIRARLYNEPTAKFVIEFHFEPNVFFTDSILTKTYYLNCLPDATDPFSYDGAEIVKCEGCKINWNQLEKEKNKKALPSFFDFFDPPNLPDNNDDPIYADINAILQNDFELGFYLKERVIPKAILFFTGEISDSVSSDSETDDDDDEEDQTKDDEIHGAVGGN